MHPEFTAHQASPHARVTCVDCHVGAGAGWYVRSKLSGARQVFKTVLNTYPRPIETPVANLRPAPANLRAVSLAEEVLGSAIKGYQSLCQRRAEHSAAVAVADQNRRRRSQCRPGQRNSLAHEHRQHHYLRLRSQAAEHTLRAIQDVKGNSPSISPSGAKPEEIAKMSRRRMDCVDCHNRPTHIYLPPDRSVDDSLAANRIDVEFALREAAVCTGADGGLQDDARSDAGYCHRHSGVLSRKISPGGRDEAGAEFRPPSPTCSVFSAPPSFPR